jgi:hypothetical protein
VAVVDLDAKRAARSEAERKPHQVVFGGETFSFPPTVPLEALDLMAEGRFRSAFRLLLADDSETARFMAHRPDDGDLDELMRGLYGQALGESSASLGSSANGGRPSSKTGKRTTAGTSRKTATGLTNAERAGS